MDAKRTEHPGISQTHPLGPRQVDNAPTTHHYTSAERSPFSTFATLLTPGGEGNAAIACQLGVRHLRLLWGQRGCGGEPMSGVWWSRERVSGPTGPGVCALSGQRQKVCLPL